MNGTPNLVSHEWLNARLDDPGVILIDATVHLPDTGRDAKEEYLEGHIPSARFFDLDVISDPDNPRPRKIPTAQRFADEVSKLGISNEHHVVAYDSLGLYSAARAWWMFQHFGHTRVSVLDGGLVNWKQAGLPVTASLPERNPQVFEPRQSLDLLTLWPEVLCASQHGDQILDARTVGRWSGKEMDRYPGVRPGHIPGSRCLYWGDLLERDSRKLLPLDVLKSKFEHAGYSIDEPGILTCGSGLTACILALALSELGVSAWKVYDGSWDEWGRNPELPVGVQLS